MKCPFCIKVCTKCGRILVAYEGNFSKKKSGKYGLEAKCKKCRIKDRKQYYEEHREEELERQKRYNEEHREERLERNKQYYEEHREERLEKKKEYYEENKEERLEYDKQYYEEHREERLEKKKEYYEENKEEIAERQKKYYEENKEEIAERQKKYYEENKEEIAEKKKQYHKENPHVKFNSSNKRRSKLENQGRGVSKEQWKEMFDFFEWKCAYSGERLSNSNIRSIDHIDCLDNGGLNEIWNVVPMYRPYNSSKQDKNIETWYRKQPYFSEERLQKIYEWCEYAWNKWGYETEEEIVFNYCELNDKTIERYLPKQENEIV